jgi:hypothetical protein
MTTGTVAEIEAIDKLTKDLKEAAAEMGPHEIRYLVDGYYALQEYRKASGNQLRAAKEAGEPASILEWIFKQSDKLEVRIKMALDKWTDAQAAGKWLKSLVGIGPVLSAGLLANIEIEKAPTAGHIWSFAGLDPSVKWLGREGAQKVVAEIVGKKKLTAEHIEQISRKIHVRSSRLTKDATKDGKLKRDLLIKSIAKRPWNASLKTLCWKIGDCMVKFHNDPKCFYGHLYAKRKTREVEGNNSGKFKDLAARTLKEKNFRDKDTIKTYESGKLPDGRIDLRARRWAVKILLSHLHEVLYWTKLGKKPPVPYAFTKSEHTHYIEVPNQHTIKDFDKR